MLSTTAVGLTAGNSILGSSSFYSNTTEKLSCGSETGFTFVANKNAIIAKKSSNYSHSPMSNSDISTIKSKEHVTSGSSTASCTNEWVRLSDHLEDDVSRDELSVEALLFIQKSLLEKQWNISTERTTNAKEKINKKVLVTGSRVSARTRRLEAREKMYNTCFDDNKGSAVKQSKSTLGEEVVRNQFKSHVKGVTNEVLLTQSEVIVLSNKIKIGLRLEEHKLRLKKKLGSEPSEEQLATYMRLSRTELRTKQIECTLAREKLALSNVRLVISIAQKYDNMGAQMADLVQGGLIGLLRGIERYDSSKGFKISTYVYWWIRQGVSRALMENSRILRLPTHLYERQTAIRNAKIKLEEQGITPSIDSIAESLNISTRKVINATRAITKVFSLDRGAYCPVNGHQTLDRDIADNCMENNPWHGVDETALKDEVNKLIDMSLGERERYIIRLYYGLDNDCLTWEDIGKRIGLSREGVRKIGLVALEKLKHAAKTTRLETMLINQ
ncbi:RNA polymerase sigma factor sigA-like [Rutidosis leptorrhynchoides]|uniref:RNA polymerase sigma factor sigA-like n=1 Tax=Rutidosis leptorrhynchoides TaxID=125765 RepID=UPI003A9A582F